MESLDKIINEVLEKNKKKTITINNLLNEIVNILNNDDWRKNFIITEVSEIIIFTIESVLISIFKSSTANHQEKMEVLNVLYSTVKEQLLKQFMEKD